MSDKFIRKPGSVFVTVAPPKPVRIPNATHIGERFKSWVNVASDIASEAQPTPAVQTPAPEPKKASDAPLGNPADVRIYRRESSGKQTKIWEGSAPHNIDAWCQSQADSGCLITMHDAESVKHFHPAKERESADAPPIRDKMKSETEPEATPASDSELSEGQQVIVKALCKTRSHTLESIANRTGLNALYIMLECRNLAKLGIVVIVSTVTCRRYRLGVTS